MDTYRQEWNSGLLASCTNEIRAQAGVAILFRNGLAVDIKVEGKDRNGRVVWALVELYAKKILIIGVYAPPQGDNPKFFKEDVFPILDKVEYDHVILGGDWNLGMDTDLDYEGYTQADQVRPKSRQELHKQVDRYDLIDIYREMNQNGVEKTWRLWNKSRRRADKEARLDYFLVDTAMASFVDLVGVSTPFTSTFDHRPVIMKIDFNKVKRGPGYWKFNNSMLDDQDFCKKVRDTIARILYEYQSLDDPGAEPIEMNEILLMTPEQQSELKMSINPHQFLEFLLFSIKGVARRHGQHMKADLIARKETAEAKLIRETKNHDDLIAICKAGHCAKSEEALMNSKTNIKLLQKQIYDIDTHMCEGAYIRCGTAWKCESEAPSKIFFQQEKWCGQQRFIGLVEVESDEPGTSRLVTNQPEIEQQIHDFYSNLYRKRVTSSTDADLKGFMGDIGYNMFHNSAKNKISPYVFEKNDRPLSADEILAALFHGKHGVAPGLSGFSREFYQHFSKILIGFIMKYVRYTEEIGILSDNQRIGVITLLPKGQKDKKTLKNWRPITLLSTLYKIISGAIGNRFKEFLPKIIDLGQKGFVDGRQMSEVTRLLYDTIVDAYNTKGKKAIIMSIDFEKAFDSVSFSFIEKVIETAGFPKTMRKWVKILLNDFKSHVNHAGNLLKLIELGRGARQGDPIASTLFVLAIEVLLIAIRTNDKIEPYTFQLAFNVKAKHKVEAYADDVNLTLPRKEESIREVITVLDNFEKISGLRVNKDKTQVLRIGKDAESDPILCPELGLKWVSKLKILGIYLSATPADMEANLTEKIDEIDKLLNSWSYRNMTIYGRIMVVKALALSKITHLIQVVPNPNPVSILLLQRKINSFIWTGKGQKKVVVNREIAELPQNEGGLAIPNLVNFWNSLKLAWLTRLVTSDDCSTWKRVLLARLGAAMNIPNLTTSRLLSEGPHSISKAADSLCNPFWKSLFKLMPQLERTFYRKNVNIIGERVIWDNNDYLQGGKPLSRKSSNSQLVKSFNTISDFISKQTNVLMSEEEATAIIGRAQIPTWNLIVERISTHLTQNGLTWYSIDRPVSGPNHWGWSRLVSETYKARKYYPLLSTPQGPRPRNSNERVWSNAGLTTYNATRWDNLYRNQSRLKCNLRVKYEEFRILWGRQELNRYKDKYAILKSGNSVACSYCHLVTETEMHLYVDCDVTDEFWHSAKWWFSQVFRVAPSLLLKGPRLFGLEKEPPTDLSNIFYRCARYCIYNGRNKTITPSLRFFITLVRDELKEKYKGTKFKRYAASPDEAAAITWMKAEMGWTQTLPEKLYPQTSK